MWTSQTGRALILLMLGISAFTAASVILHTDDPLHPLAVKDSDLFATVVVPAREEGFKARFINEHCWFAIRIHAKHIPRLKYIAAYQVAPVAAIRGIGRVCRVDWPGWLRWHCTVLHACL